MVCTTVVDNEGAFFLSQVGAQPMSLAPSIVSQVGAQPMSLALSIVSHVGAQPMRHRTTANQCLYCIVLCAVQYDCNYSGKTVIRALSKNIPQMRYDVASSKT